MLSSIEITQDIICNKLSKLNINKAPGVDGVVPGILVENADILSEHLLYIYIGNLLSVVEFRVTGRRQMLQLFSRRVIKLHHVIIGLLA